MILKVEGRHNGFNEQDWVLFDNFKRIHHSTGLLYSFYNVENISDTYIAYLTNVSYSPYIPKDSSIIEELSNIDNVYYMISYVKNKLEFTLNNLNCVESKISKQNISINEGVFLTSEDIEYNTNDNILQVVYKVKVINTLDEKDNEKIFLIQNRDVYILNDNGKTIERL